MSGCPRVPSENDPPTVDTVAIDVRDNEVTAGTTDELADLVSILG